jgi:hypothetical protein
VQPCGWWPEQDANQHDANQRDVNRQVVNQKNANQHDVNQHNFNQHSVKRRQAMASGSSWPHGGGDQAMLSLQLRSKHRKK